MLDERTSAVNRLATAIENLTETIAPIAKALGELDCGNEVLAEHLESIARDVKRQRDLQEKVWLAVIVAAENRIKAGG